MEELDVLLDGIYVRAREIQTAQDPEKKLREFLDPVRAFLVQKLHQESTESVHSFSNSSNGITIDPRPFSYISGAAAKFQKMVTRSPSSQGLSTRRNGNKLAVKLPQTYLYDAANRLHVLVTGTKTLSIDTSREQEQQSKAAIHIEALVEDHSQRHILARQSSHMVQGTKILKQFVLKTDRISTCHELDVPPENMAPNFRRLEGTPLYGSGQPSLGELQMMLDRVAADGFTKVVWVNLSEEAVIYVKGKPFTARHSAMLAESDLIPGITGHKIQVLESSLKSSLQEELKAANNRFEFWNEVALREHELVVDRAEPGHVMTLPELYESTEVAKYNDTLHSVMYRRIPIERENAPEQGHLEGLMRLVEAAKDDNSTAFVFNCQVGKHRTTTAMVIARLVCQRHSLDLANLRMNAPLAEEEHPNKGFEAGNFAVIREVQKYLKNGREAKRWVDDAINECATVCNIRTVINTYHDLSLAAAKPAKRSYYLHHAMSFLERYFYLIVFGAYIIEQKDGIGEFADNNTQPSFSKWLQQHPDMFRMLDDLGGVRYKSDKVLSKCVLKMDHFFGIARIPFELTPNIPNYRRIASEPIFGTAQCLENGIIDVIEHLRGEFDRAIWINLREEAVIYVTGRPFCVRHEDDLMVNMEYPGIEVDEITAIERQVKLELQTKVQKDKGLFVYWYEPREMVNDETVEHIDPLVDVKTLTEVYKDAVEQTGFDLRYARIPVSDETAPEEKDLDDMVRLLLPSFLNELGLQLPSDETPSLSQKKLKTAVICNCQMGRGRTTTALVCVYMLRVVLEESASSLLTPSCETSSLKKLLDGRTTGHRRHSAAIAGEFVVIRKLLKTLNNGSDCKLLVDYAIDQCEHMQNLRDCISQCRDLAMDRDLPSTKRDFFMLRAVNYLERYFYLMCFASYVLEERVHYFQRNLFVTWMNERYGSALYELLDNLCFEEEIGAETHVSSMRWRWRRKRKLVSRLE
ncbi:unnamed protein product [Peronospora belbahrii]|uniref:Paladin n=1 Tax=Peronospora belbahrii TaxID=622444 RepID=A0AAU9KP08_9STRA|nr:unnamed protein product [Peronospora belbahrii]CAH0518571.1 unnamed protein product [Peronospora belbahrii]